MSDTAIQTLKNMLAHLDDAKKYQSLRDVMETLNAPDLAAVFEDLPQEKMPVLFRLMPKDLAAEVFAELSPETQEALIQGLSDRELKLVIDELFVDDATDLVEEMPASVVKRILAQAAPDTRKMINELLKYPEDSAGGVMTTEFMELRPDMTVRQAMDAIRKNGIDKETINNCYVTNADRTLVGVVSLRSLVLEKDEDRRIDDFMDTNVVSVTTSTDQEQTSHLFEKYGLLAVPVVDGEKRLVGIVTVDDAISILQDEADEDIAKMSAMAPTDKPYFRRSMWDLYKSRAHLAAVFDGQRHLLQHGHPQLRGCPGCCDGAHRLHPHAHRYRRQCGQPEHFHHHPRHRPGRDPRPRPAPGTVAGIPGGHSLRRHAGGLQLCQAADL